jgi:phenylalanyl-tRNA synthetase alpha chain
MEETQAKVLHAVAEAEEGAVSVPDLSSALGVDQALVSAAGEYLKREGLVTIEEETHEEVALDELGKSYAAQGLPERRIALALRAAGGTATISEVPRHAPQGVVIQPQEVGGSLKVLTALGVADKKGAELALTEKGKVWLDEKDSASLLLDELSSRGSVRVMELAALGLSDPYADLRSRKKVLRIKERRTRRLVVTADGKKVAREGVETAREVTQLDSNLLSTGEWQSVLLKEYDIALQVAPEHPGKTHPLQKIIDETRHVFIEMGFCEERSPYVESGFWNFDALFQPQDHPAREMQDTFFLEKPAQASLPGHAEWVSAVKACHENGGDTGSKGWGYAWDEKKARQAILRTHNTATSIRAIAENPNPPRKCFSVSRVFRRETVDYKHLPEFYQVDGIIVDEKANLTTLLGTLAEFYRRMGFPRVKFRPSYFPYTEPSVEVFVYFEKRKDWFELGGSGIFRPEVTRPFGCEVPVLAWGLGLERLAMLRYGYEDIRHLYWASAGRLRETPLVD